ncbi:MAG: hypothetical protein ABSE68_01485 [Minisyncoccia bacterium]
MEQPKNNSEDLETKMTSFREEMRGIVEEERKPEQTAHYPGSIDADELIPEDLGVWEKIKNETITQGEMAQFRDSLLDETGHPKEGVSPGRIKFMAFFNNKAGGIISKRQVIEFLRKKQQGK